MQLICHFISWVVSHTAILHLPEMMSIFFFLAATSSSLTSFLNAELQAHAKDSTGGILSHINHIATLMPE